MASDAGAPRAPRYVYGESLWCEAPSFLWCCIPKNASRSLVRMLTAKGGRRISTISPDVQPRKWVLAAPKPALSFGFVRDPYARLISAWRNKLGARPEAEKTASLFVHNPGLYPGMSLDAFVEWLAENLDARGPDKHWRRQSDFLVNEEAELCVDFVGKVESLAADLAQLAPVLGHFDLIAHTNKSRKTSGEPEPELSDRARRIVQDLYREDFERFGYPP